MNDDLSSSSDSEERIRQVLSFSFQNSRIQLFDAMMQVRAEIDASKFSELSRSHSRSLTQRSEYADKSERSSIDETYPRRVSTESSYASSSIPLSAHLHPSPCCVSLLSPSFIILGAPLRTINPKGLEIALRQC